MKYQTIVFDINKPTLKQVKVPLESDYGVAVKVYKDGQPVSADLSVGSVACTEGPNGWKLAELSSGNTPTTKYLPVEASKAPSMSASVSATLSAAAVS